MSEITIAQLYVKTVFRHAAWTDDNKNNKLEPAELHTDKAFDDPRLKIDKIQLSNTIETEYKPLIEQIDINKDGGLSIDEIKSHLSAIKNADFNIDLDKVVEHLVNSGRYDVPELPIIFLTDDKIPEDLKPLLQDRAIELKNSGNAAVSVNISKVNGIYGRETNAPSDKVSVIIVNHNMLGWLTRKISEISIAQLKGSDLMRNIEHAKQYLTGKTNLYDTIHFMLLEQETRNVSPNPLLIASNMKEFVRLNVGLPYALLDLEAYKASLKYEINAKEDFKDDKEIHRICMIMNSYLLDINDAKNIFKDKFKLAECVQLFDDLRANVLSDREIAIFNLQLENISDRFDAKSKKGCQIYPNINRAQFDEIYTEEIRKRDDNIDESDKHAININDINGGNNYPWKLAAEGAVGKAKKRFGINSSAYREMTIDVEKHPAKAKPFYIGFRIGIAGSSPDFESDFDYISTQTSGKYLYNALILSVKGGIKHSYRHIGYFVETPISLSMWSGEEFVTQNGQEEWTDYSPDFIDISARAGIGIEFAEQSGYFFVGAEIPSITKQITSKVKGAGMDWLYFVGLQLTLPF